MLTELNEPTLPQAARGKRAGSAGKPAAHAGEEDGRPCRRVRQSPAPRDDERIEAELDCVAGRGDK